MAKPTKLPEWGSDLSNVTEPSSGQKATGWTTGQVGVSSYENWKSNLVYDWLSWLGNRVRTKSISPLSGSSLVCPAPHTAPWQYDTTDGTARSGLGAPGILIIPTGLDIGDRLRDIYIARYGDASATLTTNVVRVNGAGTKTVLATLAVTPAASWAYSRINFGADTGEITINVASGGPTFTRTSGNFITDGIVPGMSINMTGFTNAGNNVTKIVSTVTSTVITVTSGTGLVTESGGGNERITVTPITLRAYDAGDPTLGPDSIHIENISSAVNLRIAVATVSYDEGDVI